MDFSNHASDSRTSPASPDFHASSTTPLSNGRKRKRSSIAGEVSDVEDNGEENNMDRWPKTKRACNECRQQKLKCDVVPEPFQQCSRCQKLRLECRIDLNFKRVGKRSKNAEMERELLELRKQLAERESTGDRPVTHHGAPALNSQQSSGGSHIRGVSDTPTRVQSDPAAMLHESVAGSLLDLSRGGDMARQNRMLIPQTAERTLGDIILPGERIDELFKQYFMCYHDFLPVLDTDKTPDQIYELSSLLFWVVICVAARRFEDDPTLFTGIQKPLSELIWATVSAVPQNYHVVKALAIVCTWPLPKKSTSQDQTFILSGIMHQVALQTGLHRPTHAQDFYTRQRIELRDEDVRDRLKTWAVCNIVTQSISTAFGQPPKTVYDWTLTSISEPQRDDQQGMTNDLYWRLQIERFCNKVSQKCYNNRTDPIGITGEEERAAWISLLIEDHRNLESEVEKRSSPINRMYMQAAGLHLHLSAFFDSNTAPNYVNDLLQLYLATTKFLRTALELQHQGGPALRFATHHLMMIVLGAGTALMKLLNSFFARHVDVENARQLFSKTVWGVRAMSVWNNDLPARLAEVLAQLWRWYGAGAPKGEEAVDSSLKLKIQCRMSMSLVFDCIWRWREEFQFKNGDGTTANLDTAVNNPTNPDMTTDAAVNNGLVDPSLTDLQMAGATVGGGFGDYNYEVFDPLTWMLDVPGEFPYMTDAMGPIPPQALYT